MTDGKRGRYCLTTQKTDMNLTKEIRNKIIDAALAKSDLPKRRANVKAGLKKLGLLAYSLAVDLPPEIAALPAEVKTKWLHRTAHIEIAADGFNRYNHSESGDNFPEQLRAVIALDDPVLIPVHFGTVSAKDHAKLKDAAATLIKAHREANAYENELCTKLRAIVSTANTRDQLLKAWPEGEKFIPKPAAKSRALVDTKTVLDVNKTLGL